MPPADRAKHYSHPTAEFAHCHESPPSPARHPNRHCRAPTAAKVRAEVVRDMADLLYKIPEMIFGFAFVTFFVMISVLVLVLHVIVRPEAAITYQSALISCIFITLISLLSAKYISKKTETRLDDKIDQLKKY